MRNLQYNMKNIHKFNSYLCSTDLLQPVAPSGLIQVWYHSCIRLLSPTDSSELTVSDWNVGLSGLYQSEVTEWYRYVGNRLLQSARTGCNRHDAGTNSTASWKLLVSDKSGLINTDDKASVLIQTVTIIAVTRVATLSWTDLISVLLNAVTDHAFFRV